MTTANQKRLNAVDFPRAARPAPAIGGIAHVDVRQTIAATMTNTGMDGRRALISRFNLNVGIGR